MGTTVVWRRDAGLDPLKAVILVPERLECATPREARGFAKFAHDKGNYIIALEGEEAMTREQLLEEVFVDGKPLMTDLITSVEPMVEDDESVCGLCGYDHNEDLSWEDEEEDYDNES